MSLTSALPASTGQPQSTAATAPKREAADARPGEARAPEWLRAVRAAQRLLFAGTLLLGSTGLLPAPAAAQGTPPTFLISGVITALGPSPVLGGLGTVTVRTASGPFTFLVTAQTVITRDGRPATYGSLRLGDFCKAAVTWNGTVWVAAQIWDSSKVAMTRSSMLGRANARGFPSRRR